MVIKMKQHLTILTGLAIVVIGILIGIVIACHHSANYALDQSNFTTNALALVEKNINLRLMQFVI